VKGDPKVVQRLNEVLTNELTAIDQYFLHAKMFEHWGLAYLAGHERKASIDEMKHAENLTERILFLEGLPNLQDLHKLLIGENVKEALECDLRLELAAHPALRAAIADCEAAGDYVSRDLFEKLMADEEHHIDFLETQLDLVAKLGLELYAQHHIGEMGEGDED